MLLRSVLVLCVVWSSCSGLKRYSAYDDSSFLSTEFTPTETQKEGTESRKYTSYSKVFYVSEDKLSWYDAKIACKERGMILTTPKTFQEQYDLETYIVEHSLVPKDSAGYWIDGRRKSGELWTWGSTSEPVREFGWLPGEPNGYVGEDCMELKKEVYFGMGWNNYYCDQLRRYICEKPPSTHESEKNVVEDPKDHVHEEVAKGKETETVEDDGSFDVKTEAPDDYDDIRRFLSHLRESTTTEEIPSSTTERFRFDYVSSALPEEEPLPEIRGDLKKPSFFYRRYYDLGDAEYFERSPGAKVELVTNNLDEATPGRPFFEEYRNPFNQDTDEDLYSSDDDYYSDLDY